MVIVAWYMHHATCCKVHAVCYTYYRLHAECYMLNIACYMSHMEKPRIPARCTYPLLEYVPIQIQQVWAQRCWARKLRICNLNTERLPLAVAAVVLGHLKWKNQGSLWSCVYGSTHVLCKPAAGVRRSCTCHAPRTRPTNAVELQAYLCFMHIQSRVIKVPL